MKKILVLALTVIMLLTCLIPAGLADLNWVNFTPQLTPIMYENSSYSDIIGGSFTRAMFSSIILVDLGLETQGTAMNSHLGETLAHKSLVGRIDNVMVYAGYYDGYYLLVLYSINEKAASYALTPVSKGSEYTTMKNIVAGTCNEYYENNQDDLKSALELLSSIFSGNS